jgi:hypothetical protein
VLAKVFDYKKNIKPAPNPHYLLDKYYGNLSIQEYRILLKSQHLLITIDKPLTRLLPELHEDNDIENYYNIDNINNSASINNQKKQMGTYKVKRHGDKENCPNKSSILKENFGLQ